MQRVIVKEALRDAYENLSEEDVDVKHCISQAFKHFCSDRQEWREQSTVWAGADDY